MDGNVEFGFVGMGKLKKIGNVCMDNDNAVLPAPEWEGIIDYPKDSVRFSAT